MPDTLPSAFELRLPTDMGNVRVARLMVEGLLGAEGCHEDDVADAGLLVTEILQNAIEHGSVNDGTEWVALGCRLEGCTMTLHIVDPGTGLDPREALTRDPTAPPPLEAIRGRGLFLINRLASAFDRGLAEHGGLRVIVRKDLESA